MLHDNKTVLATILAHELILVELLLNRYRRFPPEQREALKRAFDELPDLTGTFEKGALDIGMADDVAGFALLVRDARNRIEGKALQIAEDHPVGP
jgi:hypothetical protein